MKKIILTSLVLLFTMGLYAQRPDREQIRAAKVAFLTTRLDLTSEQAQTFWPVFNDYEKRKSEMGKAYGERKRALVSSRDYQNITNEAATQMLDIYLEQKESEAKLEKEYLSKFKEVLTAQQTWKLIRAEGEFRRSLMQRISKGYRERQQAGDKKGN